MRGKVLDGVKVILVLGITPAHAGKSGWLDLEPPTFAGSPPRMRGKGVVYVFVPEKLRITPAHAGKRESRQQGHTITWDHPRTCGEKFTRFVLQKTPYGSPPRMLGKDANCSDGRRSLRITPAYAGKSAVAIIW